MVGTPPVILGGMAEWIGLIVFSPEVEAKINSKHNLTTGDVKDAVACGAAEWVGWVDTNYGKRLLAEGTDDSGRKLLVFMRPVTDGLGGTWECMTAYPDED